MGFLCNAESAIATCDVYNWDKSNIKILTTKNKKKKKKKKKESTTNPPINVCQFSYPDIQSATNAFSPRCLLGKGSHGSVFRATFHGGSLVAAVKRPTNATVSLTAQNELHILSNIRSPRIVNLIGFSTTVDDDSPNLILVVEYMPNGSLYDLIHKNPKPPGWSNRVRFALQVAKAVQTLHGSNPPVIHRDIKSSNVLIDERKNARLSDFGLALRGHVDDMHVMCTPPAGTLGYLDPCYVAPSDLSAKSDVFSFGILLLEIVSGRRAIDVNYSPHSIIQWALPLIKSGSYQSICDRRIGCPSDRTVICELAILAARCVRSTAEKRPTMAEVVECLKVVYKRVKAESIWNNLRRRVRHVERSRPFDGFDGSDGEEQVKTSRHGSRRSLSRRGSRKVVVSSSSTNTNIERGNSTDMIVELVTRGRHRVGRSKSIGSFREIKVGPETGGSEINGVKKRAQVTVKMSTVRLSKSRSMSVLHSSAKNSEMQLMRNAQITEKDVLPLLVSSISSRYSLTSFHDVLIIQHPP